MGRSRSEKYPETDTFHFHNQNPRGRVTTGDCCFRAMSLALGQSWEKTVMESSALSCKTGYCANDTKGIEKYMEFKHWQKMKMPKHPNGDKYSMSEFIAYMNEEFYDGTGCSPVMINMAGHCVCIKFHEGLWKAWDTWDSVRYGHKVNNFYVSPDTNPSDFYRMYHEDEPSAFAYQGGGYGGDC